MPLFKVFTAPNASITMRINKDTFTLGESIEGTATVASREDFVADQLRIELVALERLRPGGGRIMDSMETAETRMYSQLSQNTPETKNSTHLMYRGQSVASQTLSITNGFTETFQFKISVPPTLGPTFQGMRRDGRWLQRTWTLKAVLAVGGRPDVETARDISVSIPPPQTSGPAQVGPTTATATTHQLAPAEETLASTPAPEPPREMITSCPKCGAPISPSQEDLVITCRYCGFSVKLAGFEDIKNHSMIENILHTQQAVEAAQKFMDKGIFRSGVAQEAQITNVKLRYLPFWTFPVMTYTQCTGITGAGIAGEMRQMQNALGDKQASKLSKFGSFLKAGASAYLESQQKGQTQRTVSHSFSSHYDWPILARKSAVAEINYYEVPVARKIPFDIGRIPPEAEFLNAEYKQEEAKLRVKAEVENKERAIADGKLDTVQACSTNANVGEGELVHAPVWFVHYTFKGENYMILIDGSIGKILGGGKPLFHM